MTDEGKRTYPLADCRIGKHSGGLAVADNRDNMREEPFACPHPSRHRKGFIVRKMPIHSILSQKSTVPHRCRDTFPSGEGTL